MSYTSKPHHLIRITVRMGDNAQVWLQFLQEFNGIAPFPESTWLSSQTLILFTDSSGSYGAGAFFQNHWSYISWPPSWESFVLKDITFLELVPIVLAIYIWSSQFTAKKIILHTDNKALVQIINTKTSKSRRVMSLIRPLVLVCLRHNIQVKSSHIPGNLNEISDSIPRFQWARFRRLVPNADLLPTTVPAEFIQILNQKSPD